jgi:hypothetical protein
MTSLVIGGVVVAVGGLAFGAMRMWLSIRRCGRSVEGMSWRVRVSLRQCEYETAEHAASICKGFDRASRETEHIISRAVKGD